MRILIVEDDAVSRHLLERMLAPFGVCTNVSDGRQAVELFSRALLEHEPFDLVCLDIMMPGMDGQECLKTMRSIESEMKVPDHAMARIIMTTALDSAKSIMEAYYRGGCTAYLVKPINKEELYHLLREQKLIP